MIYIKVLAKVKTVGYKLEREFNNFGNSSFHESTWFSTSFSLGVGFQKNLSYKS